MVHGVVAPNWPRGETCAAFFVFGASFLGGSVDQVEDAPFDGCAFGIIDVRVSIK
jgi:hypothetical protein